MADNDQTKHDATKQETARREAEQKRLQEQQQARQGHENPPPMQYEGDRTRDTKAQVEKATEARATMATEYYSNIETPTPTPAELDAVMLGMLGQQELPEGSGMYKTPTQGPEEAQAQQRRRLESDKGGGYTTR